MSLKSIKFIRNSTLLETRNPVILHKREKKKKKKLFAFVNKACIIFEEFLFIKDSSFNVNLHYSILLKKKIKVS